MHHRATSTYSSSITLHLSEQSESQGWTTKSVTCEKLYPTSADRAIFHALIDNVRDFALAFQ